MLPHLSETEALAPEVLSFLKDLKDSPFQGDIETSWGRRMVASTDNSIYQVVPQAVVFPRQEEDLSLLLRLGENQQHQGIRFTPRGGGTGTNGQSLSPDIVVDVSRHLNQIKEVNYHQGWVQVQPGVVLDQLNQELRQQGFFFAPDLSPSNRATLGGMCSTDACGKGSRIYGKTSNHVMELDLVLADGSTWHSKPLDERQLQEAKDLGGVIGEVHRVVDEVVSQNQDQIKKVFPKLTRFLTGYNLAHVYDQNGQFNLGNIISGSEGTLAFVSGLKLKITPIPKAKGLILAKYANFDDSLRAARLLVQENPAAIETVDDTIVQLAKSDSIWDKIAGFFSGPEDHRVKSVNLIEFVGDDPQSLAAQIQHCCDRLRERLGQAQEAISFEVAQDEDSIQALWSLRKKGVGLLGKRPGQRRPIPFVEDTVVPPESLADFIKDFRQVLDHHGLSYGMFGHVDAGCLHVRPALDLKDHKDEVLIRVITDQVKDLVLKYGGVIWGEHGKGLRSEYMPEFFGDHLYQELRRIKGAFDPRNRLNPGKLVTPFESHERVISLDQAPLRGQYDRQIPAPVRDVYQLSLHCNGNGACFNFHQDDVMCPSYKFSRDRVHSPKGRAGMLREWLRQLSQTSYDPSVFPNARVKGTISMKKATGDFSLEVYESMNGCLSCKACTSMCPINVDIPELKAKFLSQFFTRYRRPLKDKLIAFGERTHSRLLPFPWAYNFALNIPGFKGLLARIGLVDPPKLSIPNYRSRLKVAGIKQIPYSKLEDLRFDEATVFVLPDGVTALYEAETFVEIVKFLEKIGLKPVVPEFLLNGKSLHVKGFLDEFRHTVATTHRHIAKLQTLGYPILGVDPAMTLCYRQEYPAYHEGPELKVQLLQEFLAGFLEGKFFKTRPQEVALLGHCGETTSLPSSGRMWQQVFKAFDLKLRVEKVGCCGMAGAFGHETEHQQESLGIYQMSWQPKVEASQAIQWLATGSSCRSQAQRVSAQTLLHPLEFLSSVMDT